MSKSKHRNADTENAKDNLRLNPEQRLCAKFDSKSIAEFRVASPKTMGFRVIDNCAEEHIM